MEKIKVQLVKSPIGCSRRQKETLKALGIGKINSVVEHKKTPQIEGMISKVKHLIAIVN